MFPSVLNAIVVLGFVGSCQSECPLGWTQFQDYCLILHKEKRIWESADSFCSAFGSHLATIETAEKDLNIQAFLSIENYMDPIWTDGTDQIVPGQWVWANTGQLFSFTNWLPTEPNHINTEQCVVLEHTSKTYWRSRYCREQNAFVCERKSR